MQAIHAQEGRLRAVEDALAEESALQILIDGAPFSMTMRTPGHDLDLALGLLHGEGLKSSGDEVESMGETPAAAERIAPGFKVRAYAIPKGCAAAYFPETNVLVPLDRVAERSNTPASKFIPILIRKSAA